MDRVLRTRQACVSIARRVYATVNRSNGSNFGGESVCANKCTPSSTHATRSIGSYSTHGKSPPGVGLRLTTSFASAPHLHMRSKGREAGLPLVTVRGMAVKRKFEKKDDGSWEVDWEELERPPPVNVLDLDLTPKQITMGSNVERALHVAIMAPQFREIFHTGGNFSLEEVRMSGDLRIAYVRWSMIQGSSEAMEKRLKLSKGRIRTMVGKVCRMKYTPDIQFRYDTLTPYLEEMDRKLDKLRDSLKDDDEKPNSEAGGDDGLDWLRKKAAEEGSSTEDSDDETTEDSDDYTTDSVDHDSDISDFETDSDDENNNEDRSDDKDKNEDADDYTSESDDKNINEDKSDDKDKKDQPASDSKKPTK